MEQDERGVDCVRAGQQRRSHGLLPRCDFVTSRERERKTLRPGGVFSGWAAGERRYRHARCAESRRAGAVRVAVICCAIFAPCPACVICISAVHVVCGAGSAAPSLCACGVSEPRT